MCRPDEISAQEFTIDGEIDPGDDYREHLLFVEGKRDLRIREVLLHFMRLVEYIRHLFQSRKMRGLLRVHGATGLARIKRHEFNAHAA